MAYRFKRTHGDSIPLSVTVTLNGQPYNVTGALIFFTCKRKFEDTDEQALIRKDSNTGITITDALKGEILIPIEAEESAACPPNEALPWDVQLKTTTGQIYTVADGTLTLTDEVTQRTS